MYNKTRHMKKTIWMNPKGELIECLSHNKYAIE